LKFETALTEVIRRTYNVKSFRFPRPETLEYKPGQYMIITIKPSGGEMTKHFTISSSPTEKAFIEFTKKLTGHPFSNALDTMKTGDWARINAPFGDFVLQEEHEKIGMLSGGIGITPLVSMCKYCTDKRLKNNIKLLYGNRTEADMAFRQELDEMQQQNSNLRVVHTLSEPSKEWKGLTGRIDAEMLKKEIPDYPERTFYTCGPPAMVEAMTTLLKNLSIPQEQIRAENFPGY
jgi:ferredoxin-NADP reductase